MTPPAATTAGLFKEAHYGQGLESLDTLLMVSLPCIRSWMLS